MNLYGGVLAKGFDKETLISHLGDNNENAFDDTNLIVPCIHDSKMLQLNAVRRAVFVEAAAPTGLHIDQINNVWNMFENTMWSEDEVIQNIGPYVPEIAELFRLWKNTPLKNQLLTSVGIALAHANIVGVTGFDADLSIWIK